MPDPVVTWMPDQSRRFLAITDPLPDGRRLFYRSSDGRSFESGCLSAAGAQMMATFQISPTEAEAREDAVRAWLNTGGRELLSGTRDLRPDYTTETRGGVSIQWFRKAGDGRDVPQHYVADMPDGRFIRINERPNEYPYWSGHLGWRSPDGSVQRLHRHQSFPDRVSAMRDLGRAWEESREDIARRAAPPPARTTTSHTFDGITVRFTKQGDVWEAGPLGDNKTLRVGPDVMLPGNFYADISIPHPQGGTRILRTFLGSDIDSLRQILVRAYVQDMNEEIEPLPAEPVCGYAGGEKVVFERDAASAFPRYSAHLPDDRRINVWRASNAARGDSTWYGAILTREGEGSEYREAGNVTSFARLQNAVVGMLRRWGGPKDIPPPAAPQPPKEFRVPPRKRMIDLGE